MTDRRTFLKGALSATAALSTASAANVMASSGQMPLTNIIYTKDNPGKWAKKVGSHSPEVTINGSEVTIKTNHGMSEKHFIVRHTLVLENGEMHGDKTFTPADEEAVSSYTLPSGYKGKFYATSFCNKHDLWVAEASV